MKTIGGVAVFEFEFDKNGKPFDGKQLAPLSAYIDEHAVTDLILFAHGWNNDMADARKLYAKLFSVLGGFIDKAAPAGIAQRKFAGVAVLWPSKKFTDKDLIPGGGAAALASQEMAGIRARLRELAKEPVRLGKPAPASAVRQKKVAKAEKLLQQIQADPKAQRQFVQIVRSLLSDKAAHDDDGTKDLFKVDELKLLSALRQPVSTMALSSAGGAAAGIGGAGAITAGGAAGLDDLGDSILSGVRRLLNMTTYYRMKERAAAVGVNGVTPVIRQLRRRYPQLRVHLAGHSFGGRLMTAAADAAGGADKINSLSLLQAAYSHNGLAQKFDGKHDGFFRKVITGKKVSGPILITHTRNDRAVGIAYPLASRLGGQNAAAFGDENDIYGGIGRNGAVKTPEAIKGTLLAANSVYGFSGGGVYNLNADAVISDHSDICHPQVAWAMLSAIATT